MFTSKGEGEERIMTARRDQTSAVLRFRSGAGWEGSTRSAGVSIVCRCRRCSLTPHAKALRIASERPRRAASVDQVG